MNRIKEILVPTNNVAASVAQSIHPSESIAASSVLTTLQIAVWETRSHL